MDLSSLVASSEAVEMQITNPVTNEPIVNEAGEAVALMLIGTDSDAYVKANNEILNRRLKKASMTRRVQITSDELEAESLARTVACVVDFKNVVFNGETLPFSKANAEKLLKSVPAIREQVDEFVANRANFLK